MPQLKPTRGICLNRNHPLSRGLVGLWLFNEGSGNKVFDLSGNGNICTLDGSIWKAGGVYLDGTNDQFYAADDAAWTPTNGLTVIAKLTLHTIPPVSNEGIVAHYIGADSGGVAKSQRSWMIGVTTGGKLIVALSSDGTYQSANDVTGGTIITAGSTLTAAFTWNSGDSTRVYLNGVEDGSNATKPSSLHNSTYPLYIGNDYYEYGHANQADTIINATIYWALIFNRALSASEIALLYREPFCMFDRAWRPRLVSGQIVELVGTSVVLSSLSATARVMRKVGGNVVSTTDVTAILNLFRSLLYIESNWKRESLFNGMTANAFKLGTSLSLGWFWVRVASCSVLYRGSSIGEIDFANILAVAEQDACEISPPNYISHNSGSTYFYVVRRFNNCGYQECTLAASVKVSIESTGELAKGQPNKVLDSGAEFVDGNKIKLVWYYCPLEQKSQPMCFNVYYDGRTGQINYENPLAMIGYKGRKFYTCQCGALEAGRYLFAIRTENVSGIENSSLARLRIQFVPTNPDAIDILSAEGV